MLRVTLSSPPRVKWQFAGEDACLLVRVVPCGSRRARSTYWSVTTFCFTFSGTLFSRGIDTDEKTVEPWVLPSSQAELTFGSPIPKRLDSLEESSLI